MDLTGRLLGVAAARPHVLVVAVPGHTAVRLRVEAEIGRRGWLSADSPADADLLVVAGPTGPRLTPVVETVWSQVPAPRARRTVTTSTDVADALDTGVRELADVDVQRHAQEPDPAASPPPMADLGEDRDGLMLDALHVPMGPLLPEWPAGLVLRLVLQGDVVVEAEAEVLDPPGAAASFWTEPGTGAVGDLARRPAAGHLDGLARFLGVAGWGDPAARARRLRDALLAGDGGGAVADDAVDLVQAVRRSRTLRWLVRGIPVGDDDVAGRLDVRLAATRTALASLADTRPAAQTHPDRLTVDRIAVTELAPLLVGAELAAVRLVVAVLDPDTDLIAPRREVSPHGRP